MQNIINDKVLGSYINGHYKSSEAIKGLIGAMTAFSPIRTPGILIESGLLVRFLLDTNCRKRYVNSATLGAFLLLSRLDLLGSFSITRVITEQLLK